MNLNKPDNRLVFLGVKVGKNTDFFILKHEECRYEDRYI